MKRRMHRLISLAILMMVVVTPVIEAAGERDVYYVDFFVPKIQNADVGAQDQQQGNEPAAAEEPYVQYAVTFVEHGVETVQMVDADTLARKPADPEPQSGEGHFVGWFLDGDHFPYDFYVTVTGDMKLTARFSEQHLVQFLDVRGNVAGAEWVDDGGKVVAFDSAHLSISVDKQFVHWYVEGQNPEVAFDFDNTEVNGNVRLAPYLKDNLILIFVSEGTQVEPQLIDPAVQVTLPKDSDMVRPGYAFQHWSTTKNGTEAYIPGFETESLTLYAVWKKQTVGYTVIYWKEKPDLRGADGEIRDPAGEEDYMYAYTRTVSSANGVEVEAEIVVSESAALTYLKTTTADYNYISTYFNFSHAQAGIAAKGDDSSVVNVYYNRKVLAMKFDFYNTCDNRNKGNMKAYGFVDDSKRYTETVYTMYVKLDENIYWKWPYWIEYENPNLTFGDWGAYYSFGRGPDNTFSEDMYSIFKARGFILKSQYQERKFYVYRKYYLKLKDPTAEEIAEDGVVAFNGAYYKLDPAHTTGYQQNDPLAAGGGWTGWPGKVIPGYTKLSKASIAPVQWLDEDGKPMTNEADQLLYELQYYYPLATYTLSLNAMGGKVEGSSVYKKSGLYKDDALDDILSKEATLAGTKFEGWYYDQGFADQAGAGDVMPGTDAVVYAKYSRTGVTVSFYESEAASTPMQQRETSRGGLVSYPDDNFTVGETYAGLGVFKGWSFYIDGIPAEFSATMPIGDDLDVYAQWEGVPYQVVYYADNAGKKELETLNVLVSAGMNTIADNYLYPPEPKVPDGLVFMGWYTNKNGTGRFTAATPVTQKRMEVYPVFAAELRITSASDLYVDTTPADKTAAFLKWADLTEGAALMAANVAVDTGHDILVTVVSKEISFVDKETYVPRYNKQDVDKGIGKLDAAKAYPLVITVTDSLGRTAETTVSLYVVDTATPVFTSAKDALAFRVNRLGNVDEAWAAAGLAMADDYASDSHLAASRTDDFASKVFPDTVGVYQLTFKTQDTVGNLGKHSVAVEVWDETVVAKEITVRLSDLETLLADADSYITQMEATAKYFNGTKKAGTPVDIAEVDFSAVQKAMGRYWVVFKTANGTEGGNYVNVVDRFTITSSVVNGMITPGGATKVEWKDSLTVSYEPAAGYTLDSVTVDGVVQTGAASKYTFGAVDANHTIHVEYRALSYQLTVRHYIEGTKTAVRRAFTGQYGYGAPYSVAADYTLADYKPVQAYVSGSMPNHDLELIIYYKASGDTGDDGLQLLPGEPIAEYDPENPPPSVVEARKRISQALFTMYDEDVPLAGAASRSMGDKQE